MKYFTLTKVWCCAGSAYSSFGSPDCDALTAGMKYDDTLYSDSFVLAKVNLVKYFTLTKLSLSWCCTASAYSSFGSLDCDALTAGILYWLAILYRSDCRNVTNLIGCPQSSSSTALSVRPPYLILRYTVLSIQPRVWSQCSAALLTFTLLKYNTGQEYAMRTQP